MEKHLQSLYRPLDSSLRQFRLLRLTDPTPDAPQCELETFALSDRDLPPWKALSYRWGGDEPVLTVKLDGNDVLVRPNLHTFLQQIVREKRQGWYFIDALCINQHDEIEKTHQVSLMGAIFRDAAEVIAWIMYEQNEDDDQQALSSLSRAELEAAVLENSYWTRLWIVQEVLLARRLTIRIGDLEVEWSNLVPEGNPLQRRGIPTTNRSITMGIMQPGADPYTTKLTATQILSYRHFETKSLRAGTHLPFHRAFIFFALQVCSDPHDKVFGYIGLTNSRIQVDYSMPVFDLFVASLADFFLSAGLITEDLTSYRKRMQLVRSTMKITTGNDLVIPILAFELDLFDPLVYLAFIEVAKFFSPKCQDGLMSTALYVWWSLTRESYHKAVKELVNADHKFELRYIGSVCIKVVKLIASEQREFMKVYNETVAQHKEFFAKDEVVVTNASRDMKKYSEWIAHVQGVSSQMWRRFQQSGEDDEGDLDDEESWTMIA